MDRTNKLNVISVCAFWLNKAKIRGIFWLIFFFFIQISVERTSVPRVLVKIQITRPASFLLIKISRGGPYGKLPGF